MKFHLSRVDGNVVTGTGPGWVRVGGTEYREGLVLTPAEVRTGWGAAGFEALGEADFTSLLTTDPELVLLGTGARIRFPHPGLTRALAAAGVGIEVMDTPAACRTYNILAAEGRRVTAALLLDS
ncbi:MAG: Mth938-like domain-containing protein [Casimicrobiaceae bacterium]